VSKTQYVYFIEDAESRAVKVGIAAEPQTRLQELQTGNPRKLRLLGYIDGGHRLEQGIHFLLRHHRVRGEWFRWNPVYDHMATIPVTDWVVLAPSVGELRGEQPGNNRRRPDGKKRRHKEFR
jgi:hypothetical protein